MRELTQKETEKLKRAVELLRRKATLTPRDLPALYLMIERAKMALAEVVNSEDANLAREAKAALAAIDAEEAQDLAEVMRQKAMSDEH